MQLISGLFVIVVGVVLVGQTSAAGEKQAQDLIDHPPRVEILDRDQLLERLELVKYDFLQPDVVPRAKYVAEQLYQTKGSVELFNGVTVGQLIEQNRIDLEGCKFMKFRERSALYLRTRPFGSDAQGADLGINLYALALFRSAVKYCLANEDKLINKTIYVKNLLRNLAEANKREAYERTISMHRELKDDDDLNLAVVWGGWMSELAVYVERGDHMASIREFNLRTPERNAQFDEYKMIPFAETGFYYG